MMQIHLRKSGMGSLWYLTTDKGLSRDKIAEIQKRITRLQGERDFYAYSAWIFETKPQLHAHFVFIGDATIRKKLEQAAFGPHIKIGPVYDLNKLLSGYHAKERTPQAGWSRKRQLGWRKTGSHKLEGGGSRVRLSRELERDAIEAGLVGAWQHTNAKRKQDRKEYRKRPLTARATRLSGQILLGFPELSKPVARLQAFGGGLIPPAVAAEIEFRRKQRGLTQRQLAAIIGISQGQYANAIRGHDPISALSVNRMREVLMRGPDKLPRTAHKPAGAIKSGEACIPHPDSRTITDGFGDAKLPLGSRQR
jgi:transcriptional regulator with XRE-family HTH domain